MATFTKDGDKLVEIRYERVSVIPKTERIFKNSKQFCCEASDEEIRRMIRAMDNRERTIVADELLKIYGKEAN